MAHIRHPVADRFINGIFKSPAPTGNSMDFGAEQSHTKDIEFLPTHVFFTHIDFTVQVEQSTNRSGGNTVLSSSCFGDDALFPHPFGQQSLAQTIVDLVSPRVV